MKKITILLLSLLLIACAKTEYEDSYVRSKDIHKAKMGMVLTQIKVPYKTVLNKRGAYNGYMVVRNIKTNVKYIINGSSYTHSASMIQPGTYQVEKMGWNDGAYNYSFPFPKQDLEEINSNLGKFEMRAGECLYLGDIHINKNARPTEVPFKIVDNSKNMQKDLENVKALQSLRSKIKFNALTNDVVFERNDDGTWSHVK